MISRGVLGVHVGCNIAHFDLSGHAMHNELCNYISKLKPELLVLVHGDEASLSALADSVKRYAGRVVIPRNGERIDLQATCCASGV